MTAETARIEFNGGAFVVPASTSYDRQQLIDHVLSTVRTRQTTQVQVDRGSWMVEPVGVQRPTCSGCTRPIDRAACRRPRGARAAYCVTCALAWPHLTIAFLSQLPTAALLRDVQAHYAYCGEWISWTRWPQATPPEIIDDMRLQRRFAPVLTWRCAEIQVPPANRLTSPHAPMLSNLAKLARVAPVNLA